jgi:hypothetical protein
MVVFASEDNPYIPTSNSFLASYRPAGELIWKREYDLGDSNRNDAIWDIAIDPVGYLYTTGIIGEAFSERKGQAHLTHLDNTGQILWTRSWQTERVDCGFGVDLLGDKILVSGWSYEETPAISSDFDLTVSEFNSQGLEYKCNRWESGFHEGGLATAVTKDQAVLVTGWSNGSLFAPNPVPAITMDIILMRIGPF